MTKSTPGNLHPNDPDNVWPDDGSEDRARTEAAEALPPHEFRSLAERLGRRILVKDGGTGDPWRDHWNLTETDSLLHKEALAALTTEAAPAEPAEAPTSIGALYEHWERAQEAEKGPYPESGPLHERLRWWVPYSSRHGTAGPEDDLLEAVNFIAPRRPAEAPETLIDPKFTPLIDALMVACYRWGDSYSVDGLQMADTGDSSNQMYRDRAMDAARNLARALATPPTALQEGAETLMALNAFSRICMFSAPPHKPDEERALMMSIWLEADNARRALQEGSAARSPTQEPPN